MISITFEHVDQIDIVNYNSYPDDCLTSNIITCQGVEKNCILYGQSGFSPDFILAIMQIQQNFSLLTKTGTPKKEQLTMGKKKHSGQDL